MKSTDAPSKQAVPFGTNGPREAITPTTPSGSNQASYDQGFPPITMTLKSAGGLPPKGQDMNQILFEQSSFNRYFAAGGGYVYDSTFSTAVGGYPLSARIPNSTGTGFWFNTVEDNQTNPENSTAALTGWVPMGSYGSTSISGLAATSVTLTTIQASKERLIFSGALTANINVVVPAWVRKWDVVNNCTGSFSLTVKTPSGSGVATYGGNSYTVYGDGTNISVINPAIRMVRFESAGSFTVPAGVTTLYVSGCAAGGGSGAGAGSTSSFVGGGGGGGGAGQSIIKQAVTVTPGQVINITIGNAGTAGVRNSSAGNNGGNGGSGGNTIFGSFFTLTGGGGGVGGVSAASGGAGGGAAGSGYPYGSDGQDSTTNNASADGGSGASSPFGGGGGKGKSGKSSGNGGYAAYGYGAGGGGGAGVYTLVSGLGGAGSAGSPGILIIEW